jgi:two-component system LytT family response regulator
VTGAAVRVLVVDDERPARAEVLRQLARHPEIEVVGEAADGATAAERIVELAPDLLFLDIQMPELDGFGVLQAIADEERPVVVFVTAYDEFALQAFEARAVDYLLKPYDTERFDAALARALVHVRDRSASLDALLDAVASEGRRPTRIATRCGTRFHLLDVADVERLEAARNYVMLHTDSGEYLTRATLSSLERRLDPETFMRVHRGHVVRLDSVAVVDRLASGDLRIRMRDGTEVPVARSHRRELLERVQSA